jgi:hypothetical protein
MAQVVKYLPGKCKALSSNPSTEKKDLRILRNIPAPAAP